MVRFRFILISIKSGHTKNYTFFFVSKQRNLLSQLKIFKSNKSESTDNRFRLLRL